jgi:hypothetical protein
MPHRCQVLIKLPYVLSGAGERGFESIGGGFVGEAGGVVGIAKVVLYGDREFARVRELNRRKLVIVT